MNVRPDVKAGLFILVGAALLIWALFQVGNVMDNFKEKRTLVMAFNNAQQVKQGTEIYQRGMKIGAVSQVAMAPDGVRIHIQATIDPSVRLLRGTTARIDNKSLLGGKMIELMPPLEGPFEDMGADEVLTGQPPSDLNQLMQAAVELLPAIKNSLEQLTSQLSLTLQEMNKTMTDLRLRMAVVDDLKPELISTLDAYRTLAVNADRQVTELTGKLSETADGVDPLLDGIKEDINKLTTQLQVDLSELTGKVGVLMDDSGQLVRDADHLLLTNADELSGTLKSLEVTMRNLEALSATLADKPSALIWSRGKKTKPDTSAEDRRRSEKELRSSGYISRKPDSGGNE